MCERDSSVAVQTLEEEVNALEKIDEFVVACYNILHSLMVGRHPTAQQIHTKTTYCEKNADSSKYGFSR